MYLKNIGRNLTTSLSSHSRVPRHLLYIGYEKMYTCYTNPEFVTDEDICRYIRNTYTCNEPVNVFNYLDYMVCTLKLRLDSAQEFVLMYLITSGLTILYLFILYVVGRYFVFPNIKTMSQHWQMKEYHFGALIVMAIIILPNVIFALSSCIVHEENGTLLFGEIMSKTFTSFACGFATFCFKQRRFFIDPIKLSINMALIGFGGIYVFEIMFFNMVVDHIPIERRPSFNLNIYAIFSIFIYIIYLIHMILTCKLPTETVTSAVSQSMNESEISAESASTISSLSSDNYAENVNPVDNYVDTWDVFFYSSNIFNNNVKSNSILVVIMAPIWFVVSFLIPVVTHTRPLNGWCKFQTVTSILLFPFLFYYLSNSFVYYGLMLLCILAATLTIITTDKSQIPLNHLLYGMFGILAGLTIFLMIETEIDALLWQILSFSANWDTDATIIFSSAFSQIIFLVIFCYTLIDEKLPEMAYGMLTGVSMFFTYACLPLMSFHFCPYDEKASVQANVEATYYFMIISYCIFYLGLCLANFDMRTSLGYALLYIIAVYVIETLMSAFGVIHPLGSQHTTKIFRDTNHANWA